MDNAHIFIAYFLYGICGLFTIVGSVFALAENKVRTNSKVSGMVFIIALIVFGLGAAFHNAY